MPRHLYRLRFSKTGPARFYSHHDLMRLFERGLRRAGLPISLSEGYNPRPRMAFLSALPLGLESRDEHLEVELSDSVEAEALRAQLAGELPEGLALLDSVACEKKSAAVAAVYEAPLPEGVAPDVAGLLASTSLVVERRTPDTVRKVDIRPWIASAEVDGRTLRFTITITDSGSARPDEVLKALGAAGPAVRVRTVLAEKG